MMEKSFTETSLSQKFTFNPRTKGVAIEINLRSLEEKLMNI